MVTLRTVACFRKGKNELLSHEMLSVEQSDEVLNM